MFFLVCIYISVLESGGLMFSERFDTQPQISNARWFSKKKKNGFSYPQAIPAIYLEPEKVDCTSVSEKKTFLRGNGLEQGFFKD